MKQRRGGARLRAAMGVLAAGALVAYAGVAGAAEPRADTTIKAKGTAWDKPDLTISTGDTVTWDINGGDGQTHNAVAGTGPAEDPGWPQKEIVHLGNSGTGSYTFTQPGVYTYLCQVHAAMKGQLTVTGSPVTPTPTSSATATDTATATATATSTPLPSVSPTPTAAASNLITTPAPRGSSRADTVAPAVTKLKLKALKGGAKVSFSLSEPASVTIRVKKGKKTLGTVRLAARAGSRSVTLRRMARGSYSVEIEARDARGNKAATQRKSVKVKR